MVMSMINQILIKLFCELNEIENCKANSNIIKPNMIITKDDYKGHDQSVAYEILFLKTAILERDLHFFIHRGLS